MTIRVAVDTNLLLLLVVGRTAPQWIGKHKRLRSYSSSDFNRLVEALSRARQILFTPHCISEVSNLLGHGIAEPLRGRLYRGLRGLLEAGEERFVPSADAAAATEYLRLGVTDAAWLAALDKSTVLLTDDEALKLAALNRGLAVQNIRPSTM